MKVCWPSKNHDKETRMAWSNCGQAELVVTRSMTESSDIGGVQMGSEEVE